MAARVGWSVVAVSLLRVSPFGLAVSFGLLVSFGLVLGLDYVRFAFVWRVVVPIGAFPRLGVSVFFVLTNLEKTCQWLAGCARGL